MKQFKNLSQRDTEALLKFPALEDKLNLYYTEEDKTDEV